MFTIMLTTKTTLSAIFVISLCLHVILVLCRFMGHMAYSFLNKQTYILNYGSSSVLCVKTAAILDFVCSLTFVAYLESLPGLLS